MRLNGLPTLLAAAAMIATPMAWQSARADAITDWNRTSGSIITEARIGTPPAIRIMALRSPGQEMSTDPANDHQGQRRA
jgi:hypothetical protein